MARAGVEPATFHFSGERCYQLSYLADGQGVMPDLATPTGLEPATSAVTGRRANQLRYGANEELTSGPHGACVTLRPRSTSVRTSRSI